MTLFITAKNFFQLQFCHQITPVYPNFLIHPTLLLVQRIFNATQFNFALKAITDKRPACGAHHCPLFDGFRSHKLGT